jgi:NAD(P)-dependent dehydrogenase (short-subunit alcohol dehydrogenase family)
VPNKPARPTAEQIPELISLLEGLAADRSVLDEIDSVARHRLLAAAGAVFNPDPVDRRRQAKAAEKRRRAERSAQVADVEAASGIRLLRSKPVFTTPNVFPPALPSDESETDETFREFIDARHCYICKQDYVRVHSFYDQLCPSCATFNFAKRSETADLHGRVALLTGGRVKIGYQAGIKLLRAGARVIVTTRFPRDSAVRYAAEPDFPEWRDRLEIHGLDLRHTPSVETFCQTLSERTDRLDYIINNACQTVRRPPGFYEHMMELERHAVGAMAPQAALLVAGETMEALPAKGGTTLAAELSQLVLLPEDQSPRHLFPTGQLDQDLQQVDLRDKNSWRLTLSEVSSVELIETQLVNAVAPFVLNARLKPLMLRTPDRDKHIVNVSAVEGQFYRRMKTTRHPHTNMAKAALNMMTRTSAADYHADGIHMNSVDTGWVSDEDPVHIAERKTAEQNFHPPLDIVDGAARIVDPIISGRITGTNVWGQFLKDYRPTDW